MKKQIAVLMAAATAVTTVAPAIANADMKEHKNISVAEVNKKIKEALSVRYADPKHDGISNNSINNVDDYLNSRYLVILESSIEIGNDDAVMPASDSDKQKVEKVVNEKHYYVVKDAAEVSKEIEKVLAKSGSLKVYVVDKGIKDKSAVFTTTKKHYVMGNADENDTTVTLGKVFEGLKDKKFVDKYTVYVGSEEVKDSKNVVLDKINKIEVTLKSGEKITLEENGEAFDFTKAYDKSGAELELNTNNDDSVYEKIVKFGVLSNEDDKEVVVDVPTGDIESYEVKDLTTKTIAINDIYTVEHGYSDAGESFINRFIDAKDENKPHVFNYNGVSYKVELESIKNGLKNAVVEADDNGYSLKFDITASENNDSDRVFNLQFVINGKNQKDLARVQSDLNGTKHVLAGQFMKLVGQNRYATAIEISKEKFEDKKAKSIVITGGEAIMDGLSAVPLASVNEAPILLSDKNGLNKDTMAEIDRVLDAKYAKTIYIVGGKASVPASVEKQLEDKFDVAVVRLAGANRFDTSLEVAKNLAEDGKLDKDIFVVGGNGAADAMSISPVAADMSSNTGDENKVSPILVVPKDGITRKQRDFIGSEFENGYVVGGETTVGTQVLKDLVKKTTISADRISGMNRYATNLNIIKKFYTKDNTKIMVSGLAVTSGDDRYLVDAQTAGPLAASKMAPILLTGATLDKDQVKALDKDGVLSNVKNDVYQIGGVVSEASMKEVVKVLGL